jgi:putative hemolysin
MGYVTFKDIIAFMKLNPDDPSIRGIVRNIPRIRDHQVLSQVLEQLMKEHTHIALIVDDKDIVLGMITLEDIIEELIGDIQDEYDLLPVHAVKSGAGWVVGGGISLPKLRELTGIDLESCLPEGEIHNLSGWVIGHLGDAPTGGEVVDQAGVRALVRKVRRQRVLEVALIVPQAL